MSVGKQTICQICDEQTQKYSCPRCNVLYCSVACYKAPIHSQCSETFYKDSVVQEMAMLSKQLPAGLVDSCSSDKSAEFRRMFEMLKGTDDEDLDSDDEKMDVDLAVRLADIDLNDADSVWQCLNDAERLEFESIVHGDDISNLVDMKDPWWMRQEKIPHKLVEEMGNSDDASTKTEMPISNTGASYADDIPVIYQRIAPFGNLSTKPAAKCLQHNLANVLAAYVRTYRYFNGDHIAEPVEACSYLLLMCGNLRCNQNFDDHAIAVDAVAPDANVDDRAVTAADVLAILGGEHADGMSNIYTLAALSDVHRMMCAAKKITGISKPNPEKKEYYGEFFRRFQNHGVVDEKLVSRNKLKACAKKLEYYLAYVNQYQ